MNLQTKIPLKKQANNLISYKSNILLLGSCFVENIGNKLDYFKFQNLQNPFGILFHPKSIESLVENAVNQKKYSEKDIFFHNEQWHCFDTHSKLSNISKEDLLNALNSKMELMHQQIKKSTHIIITLGTAWVYKFIKTDAIVTNCHKVPQNQFKKESLSVEEVTASLKNILSLIRSVNYEASVVFTVSPIRHLKDGFVENMQSKSHLISAIHQFLNQKSSIVNRNSFYFPSYEIMIDELRDYRFYTDDMIHPNQTAINYIWDKLKLVWMASEASKTMKEVDVVQKGLLHKPFNPKSEAYKKFLEKLEIQKRVLQESFPHFTF